MREVASRGGWYGRTFVGRMFRNPRRVLKDSGPCVARAGRRVVRGAVAAMAGFAPRLRRLRSWSTTMASALPASVIDFEDAVLELPEGVRSDLQVARI